MSATSAQTDAWSPLGFGDYRQLFPNTPPLDLPDHALTDRFVGAWQGWDDDQIVDQMARHGQRISVVFVRGYLGNWMPGNLVAPRNALRARGIDAHIVRTRTSDTVASNVDRIASALAGIPGPLLLCGHSKGGLECLHALRSHPDLRSRCVGVVLSQTPCGPSRVLESLLLREHQQSIPDWKRRGEEAVHRAGLYTVGAHRGGLQLTAGFLPQLLEEARQVAQSLPVWQTISWSSQPTTWLDSFHGRLGEIAPGCAHDGQFYLQDLIWTGLPHVLLPHLDHAQPAMGGFGFDHARYWQVLVALFVGDHPGS